MLPTELLFLYNKKVPLIFDLMVFDEKMHVGPYLHFDIWMLYTNVCFGECQTHLNMCLFHVNYLLSPSFCKERVAVSFQA